MEDPAQPHLIAAPDLMAAGAPASGQGIVLLTRSTCQDSERMRTNLNAAIRGLSPAPEYTVLDLDSLPADDARRGYPTPTLLVAGRDLFGLPGPIPPLPEPT